MEPNQDIVVEYPWEISAFRGMNPRRYGEAAAETALLISTSKRLARRVLRMMRNSRPRLRDDSQPPLYRVVWNWAEEPSKETHWPVIDFSWQCCRALELVNTRYTHVDLIRKATGKRFWWMKHDQKRSFYSGRLQSQMERISKRNWAGFTTTTWIPREETNL